MTVPRVLFVAKSANAKTGPIAACYVSALSCPRSCPLNPRGRARVRIPARVAFANRAAIRACNASGFTVNLSADNLAEADRMLALRIAPVVVTVPESFPRGERTASGTPIVLCPATQSDGVTCASCGGGRPFCSRADRRFVVAFPVHGSQRKAAADPDRQGGCYAEAGMHSRLAWRRADSALSWRDFCARVEALEADSLFRYGVAGDLPGTADAVDVRPLERLLAAVRASGVRAFGYSHKPVFSGVQS